MAGEEFSGPVCPTNEPLISYMPLETIDVLSEPKEIPKTPCNPIATEFLVETCILQLQSSLAHIRAMMITEESTEEDIKYFQEILDTFVNQLRKLLRNPKFPNHVRNLTHSLNNSICPALILTNILLTENDPAHLWIDDIQNSLDATWAILNLKATTWEEMSHCIFSICGNKVQLINQGDLKDCPLSPQAVIEIILNAHFNSEKAGAQKLDVYFIKTLTGFQITLHDNGPGFNFDHNPQELLRAGYKISPQVKGNGLRIISTHCEKAGGDLKIANHPGRGALLVLNLPSNNSQTRWHHHMDQSQQGGNFQA